MAEAANLDPPLPQEKSKACTKCGKYCLRIKRSGTKGFCDKCMKLHHEETMTHQRYRQELEKAVRKLQHDKEEAERRRQHNAEEAQRRRKHEKEEALRRQQQEREEALRRRQHEREEAERRRQHEKEEALRRWQEVREENEQKRKQKLEEDKIKAEMEKHKKAQEELKLKQIQEQTKRERDEIKLKKLTECRLLFENMQISDEAKVSMIREIVLELDDKNEIKSPTNRVHARSIMVEEIVQDGPRGRATRRTTGLRRIN